MNIYCEQYSVYVPMDILRAIYYNSITRLSKALNNEWRMTTMTAKEKIQQQVDHWKKTLNDLQREQETYDPEMPEWAQLNRKISEYRGRIYATRFIDEQIGLSLDTDTLIV